LGSVVMSVLPAAGIALVVSLSLGPIIIPCLSRLKVGQSIRDDGPERHLSKAGTPTMGGILIVTAVMVAALAMAGFSIEALAGILVMMAFGAIGFWDDYIKVVLKRSLGLRAREKIGLQLLTGFLFALLLIFWLGRGTQIVVPFSGYIIDLGVFYIPFVILVLIATSNTVNLTDGLDGLAAGVTFFVVLALGIICLMTGHYELGKFCGALIGACLGFLVFNRYPAKVFMGDTGSMALGGAVAAIALMVKAELFLLIIGGVYVLEGISVISQVLSFKLFRKRIFLMSLLHHHYELKGYSEIQIIKGFYLLSLLFVIIGLWGFRSIGQ